jgi:predicted DNA-binding transcriptional regulator AlpA
VDDEAQRRGFKDRAEELAWLNGVAREAERRVITGIPASTWYPMQAKGLVPKPIELSERCRGWIRRQLLELIEARARGETWRSLGAAAASVIEKARSSKE